MQSAPFRWLSPEIPKKPADKQSSTGAFPGKDGSKGEWGRVPCFHLAKASTLSFFLHKISLHWNREINDNLFFEILIWIHVLNSTRVMSKTARTLLRSTCSATKEKPFVLMATTMIRTAGDDDDKVVPGQQVVLEDWQSSRPAVLRTSSLLCSAYARPLQIMIYIDLDHVIPQETREARQDETDWKVFEAPSPLLIWNQSLRRKSASHWFSRFFKRPNP